MTDADRFEGMTTAGQLAHLASHGIAARPEWDEDDRDGAHLGAHRGNPCGHRHGVWGRPRSG